MLGYNSRRPPVLSLGSMHGAGGETEVKRGGASLLKISPLMNKPRTKAMTKKRSKIKATWGKKNQNNDKEA